MVKSNKNNGKFGEFLTPGNEHFYRSMQNVLANLATADASQLVAELKNFFPTYPSENNDASR